jgi:hypothetical protein
VLLKVGQHPKSVQELLGHTNIGITLDTYSHVLPGMGDGLADAMDDALAYGMARGARNGKGAEVLFVQGFGRRPPPYARTR